MHMVLESGGAGFIASVSGSRVTRRRAGMMCSPDEHEMERVDCLLCPGSTGVTLYSGLRDAYGGSGPGYFSLKRCEQCDLIWLSPRPNRETVGKYYGSRYIPYQDQTHRPEGARALMRRWLSLPYRIRYGPLHQILPPPHRGAKVLDIGCSSGRLLEAMRQVGWDVWGIEMDPAAARRAAARAGGEDRVFVGTVADAVFPECNFDLVTASHVLEHVHDPIATLERIHRWLCVGGQLQVSLPNIASLESRIFGRHWSGLDSPRHMYHFSPATLSRLLALTNFEVSARRPQFQGSSFGGSVKQTLASLVRRAYATPTTGLIYKAAVPLGWMTCALGDSASFEVLASALEIPSGVAQ
jgi:2-polyprenyl-3-methyl-5-hydroxy-6-metoxy-1,4-benzoquinol methylase